MFRVRYTRQAAAQLATAWTTAPDQQAVTEASHRIDQALARDPEDQGESRPNNRRIMFDTPLVVVYRIDLTARQVVVSNVRRY